MNNEYKIVFEGRLMMMERNEANGYERAVRLPGVRLILENDKGSILMTNEFRDENGKHDYRLPGGKMFENVRDYLPMRGDDAALRDAALTAGKLEAKQEAGVENIENLTLYAKSVAGATVEWDLYYLTGKVHGMGKQELEGDERNHGGIGVEFYPREKIVELMRNGSISEDRTVGVLFRYLKL